MSKDRLKYEDIIDPKLLEFGLEFARSLQPAIDGSKEFASSFGTTNQKLLTQFKKLKQIDSSTSITQLKTATKDYSQATEQTITALKEQQRIEKNLITTIERKSIATESTAKALAKEKVELAELNRRAKEAGKISSALTSEYTKQSIKLTRLRREYKEVALAKGRDSKEARKLRNETAKLAVTLERVDKDVRDFKRNIGNYGSAMSSARKAVKRMTSAMGLLGGAYLAFRVLNDAKNRVIQFDKAMQNLAGVLQSTRKSNDVVQLERQIIKVASTSIKTANEVANLAESLATLGLRGSDLENLLKPSNDLSIALGATSEEAGEFLVQTLNAFGAGADEAGKYADQIASIRQSTTLDFTKMRDSFQYIAPISKILNKDLAYTGSVVGILADNSLKAESAGRLLATAQQKLAKQGKTLQDGLDQINKAISEGKTEIEVLATASEVFGTQSAKVGVILAQNNDLIEENAEKIRDNTGALKTLTDQQLESLDAKLKTLDSTWEKFILNLESGDGKISQIFKSLIGYIEGAINALDSLNRSAEGEFSESQDASYLVQKKALEGSAEYIKSLREQGEAQEENVKYLIDAKKKDLKLLEESTKAKNTEIELLEAEIKTRENAYEKLSLTEKFKDGSHKRELKQKKELLIQLNKEKGASEGRAKALVEFIKTQDKASKRSGLLGGKESSSKSTEKSSSGTVTKTKDNSVKDAENLRRAELQSVIKHNDSIVSDEKATYEERLIANTQLIQAKKDLAEFEKSTAIASAKGRTDEIKRIELQHTDKVSEIEKAGQKKSFDLLKKSFEEKKKAIQEAKKEQSKLEQGELDGENQRFNSLDLSGLDNSAIEAELEKHEQNKLEIKKRYAKLALEAQITAIKSLLSAEGITTEQRAGLEASLAETKQALNAVVTANTIDSLNKNKDAEAKSAEQRKEIVEGMSQSISTTLNIDAEKVNILITSMVEGMETTTEGILQNIGAVASVVGDLANSVFQQNIENIDAQIEASQASYDRQIELAEGDEDKKKALEEQAEKNRQRLEKKKRKEQKRQAIFNKATAITEAGIYTALAVIKALPNVVLASIVGALGAVQAVAIASAPIPKYAKGTDFHEGGKAWLGDGGVNEVAILPDNTAFVSPATDTLYDLPRGTKVIPSLEEFDKLQGRMTISSIITNGRELESKRNSFSTDALMLKKLDKLDKLEGINRLNSKLQQSHNEHVKTNKHLGLLRKNSGHNRKILT